MTARWSPTEDASDMRADHADDMAGVELCEWCGFVFAEVPAYRSGLCRSHWDEAHDGWDVTP